jgi:23S rRNA-/tRNA-specific pseudouridylate synthase
MKNVFYIQLKKGEGAELGEIVHDRLSLKREKADELIRMGAVWNVHAKKRLKEPSLIITAKHLIRVHMPVLPVIPYSFEQKDIILEDRDFFIVFKKPGYPAVPAPYADICSLSWGLEEYCRSRPERCGVYPVNRLDTPASGLLFIAKNKKMQAMLHMMFKQRRIKKYYLVRTPSFTPVKESYIITDDLEWKGKTRKAVSYIRLLKKEGDFFCFLVRPQTGRTHQIRRHFERYLRPICGDARYGSAAGRKHLSLLCYAYIFRHPLTGQKQKVSYLPEDFAG